MATTLIVCSANFENSINLLDGKFRLTNEEKRLVRGELNEPSPEGDPFWAMFRLRKEGAVGQ